MGGGEGAEGLTVARGGRGGGVELTGILGGGGGGYEECRLLCDRFGVF